MQWPSRSRAGMAPPTFFFALSRAGNGNPSPWRPARVAGRVRGREPMSASNKIRNVAQRLSGQAKRVAGRATGDQRLEDEGWTDQTKANLKQRGEKLKDVFRK